MSTSKQTFDSESSVESSESVMYELHDDVLDAVRDLWPTIKGIDILLFQNDLFLKIRQLEVAVENLGAPRGFLPASFAEMIGLSNIDEWKSGSDSYDKVWADLISSAATSSEEALDVFEEDICGWVEDMIPADYNFFMAALDEGTLNADWLSRAQIFFEKAASESSTIVEAEVPAAPVIKPSWRSSSTRRRHASFGLGSTPAKRRVRLTRRSGK